jgi:hypothetical protein
MLRKLQQRAEDLAESLLVHELEMKRSRTLEYRMQAFRDFEAVVDRIDALRRDAEILLPTARAKDAMLESLDRKVASVMRGAPYRIAAWFASEGSRIGWLVGPASVEPHLELSAC